MRRQMITACNWSNNKILITHVFRVLAVHIHPPRKTARAHEQLARCGVVPVRAFAGERFARNLLQQPFANAPRRGGQRYAGSGNAPA